MYVCVYACVLIFQIYLTTDIFSQPSLYSF